MVFVLYNKSAVFYLAFCTKINLHGFIHKMFRNTFYSWCWYFEPLKMHICWPSYHFSPYHIYRFFQSFSHLLVRTDQYSETNFFSSTISSSSKISFAKLFFVKDRLLFTAKVSDSIDTSFISPRFCIHKHKLKG